MGVEPAIRAASTKEEGVSWVNSNGKAFATMRATGRTDVQSLTSEYEIFRGTLAKIFIQPSMEKVQLVFNEYVDTYHEVEDGVQVKFTNGKPSEKFDLLVAADGLGSRIRGQMLGKPSRDQIHDEGVHVAYFTIKKDLLSGSKLAEWYNAPGGRVVFLRPDPAGQTRGHFMTVTKPNDLAGKKRQNDTIAQGNSAYMTLLEKTFADAGWQTPQVLAEMRNSTDFYCSLFGQVRSPKLQSGNRVVLLGDAGYATPGIGTSLATIGAYVLAGEMLREPTDIPLALQRYEQLMVPFVKTHQGDDNAMQIINPQSRWGIAVRNTVFAVIFGLGMDRVAMRAAALLGFSEKKLDMPDYAWPEGKEGEPLVAEK